MKFRCFAMIAGLVLAADAVRDLNAKITVDLDALGFDSDSEHLPLIESSRGALIEGIIAEGEEIMARVKREIAAPMLKGMAKDGMPYQGVLYAGLMLTEEGPKLIEYNARFGDPECQVLMMRFDGDLVELLLAVAEGKLAEQGPVTLADRTALTIVMAANGYPGTPEKGGAIKGIDAAEAQGARVFHAGTAEKDGAIIANGGRVLNVTATGDTVGAAQAAAYAAVDAIDFPTGFCRRDIGWREVAREAR